MWLPFPVLLLSALPAAVLRGAAGFTPSLDSDFTFTLPAGRKECFYQPMPLKASLEIEYQVSVGMSWPSLGRAAPHGRLTSSENLRTATEVNPRKVSWEADLLSAGVLGGAPGSLELTSLASPKIDTYSPSSLFSGRKEASIGDVSGITLCFLVPACHFKLVYIHYSSEKFAIRG